MKKHMEECLKLDVVIIENHLVTETTKVIRSYVMNIKHCEVNF